MREAKGQHTKDLLEMKFVNEDFDKCVPIVSPGSVNRLKSARVSLWVLLLGKKYERTMLPGLSTTMN